MPAPTEVSRMSLDTSDDEAMADIKTFTQAVEALQAAGIEVRSTADYGSGFSVVSKSVLVGVPFVILGMRFSEGDYGHMTILHVVTEKGDKYVITDGSTGIYAQAVKYSERGLGLGLYVPTGLVQSDYTKTDDTGKPYQATTYYLS